MASRLSAPASYELISHGHRRDSSFNSIESSSINNKSYNGPNDRPQKLETRTRTCLNQYWFSSLILLTCLPFLLFGGLVSRYDGHATADHSKLKSGLIQASKLGPTLFAPLFTAVAGRAILKFVQWRVERGASVGVLDQMIGSTTMFGALCTQVELRAVNAIALAMIALWALSPVGGQASTRILEFGFANRTLPGSLDYLDVNNTFGFYAEADKATEVANAGAIFVSALSSSSDVKNSSQDVWGNVKIPMIEKLSRPDSDNADGWVGVPTNGTVYSSLAGIPVSLRGRSLNASFSIETSYWSLSCPVLESDPGAGQVNGTPKWSTFNTEDHGGGPWWLSTSNASSTRWNISTFALPERKVLYESWDDIGTASYAECLLQTTYVEAQVWCADAKCQVDWMRNSLKPHRPGNWSTLDSSSRTFMDFASGLTSSIMGHEGFPGPIQAYFLNPGQPFSTAALHNTTALHQLPKDLFAISLAQLMNTYWIVSVAPTSVPAGLIQPKLVSTLNDTQATALSASNVLAVTIYEVFLCNRTWLAILWVTDLLLLTFGLAGLVFAVLNKGPDLAFNMSSMLRDSPYVATQPRRSDLDSTERSRAMKFVRVRYGDVMPNNAYGKVGVGQLSGDLYVGELNRARLYL